MSDWSEIAKKFTQDSTDARTEQERATQKHSIVTAGGPGLWKQLQDAAQQAVNYIKKEAESAPLLLTPSETEKSFSITYARPGGQQRTASAKFSPGTYKVSIWFSGSAHSTQNHEYDIMADDDGAVYFSTSGSALKVDDLVKLMLSQLV